MALPPEEPAMALPPEEPVMALPPEEPVMALPPEEPAMALPPEEPAMALPPEEPCYHAVEALPPPPPYRPEEDSRARALCELGRRGGGLFEGRHCSAQRCFELAAEADPACSYAWSALATRGGGKGLDARACAERAVALSPQCPRAWNALGFMGGGTVDGEKRGARECVVRSLELDSDFAYAWNSLGVLGGGRVFGKEYTPQACQRIAVDREPGEMWFWVGLALAGGDSDDDAGSCLRKALECDTSGATAELGQLSFLISAQSREKSSHSVEFVPSKPFARGDHVVASFPGKFGFAWDLLQGQRTADWQSFLERLGVHAKWSGELKTACVFLPPGSRRFGKHRRVKPFGGTCYCSKRFEDGGLDYIREDPQRPGKTIPHLCRGEDIDPKRPTRTTFGCEWFSAWKQQVQRAVEMKCTLYAVVPDDIPDEYYLGAKPLSECKELGNSQRGEVAYMTREKHEVRPIKLSDFVMNMERFTGSVAEQ